MVEAVPNSLELEDGCSFACSTATPPFLRPGEVRCVTVSLVEVEDTPTLWNPDVGHGEGDRRRTQELRIFPVGTKIFRMKRIEKASTHQLEPVLWSLPEKCPNVPLLRGEPGSLRPLNTGKGEGSPAHPTPPSLQGREGCSLSKGLCQSFVGVGGGIIRARESPSQKHSPQQ